jgi:hypothetical protein
MRPVTRPRRVALLVGAQTGGLRGVHDDVARMRTALEHHGFAVETRTAGDATRDGILDGLDRMARDARQDDALVFYYAGHGASAATGTDARRALGAAAPRIVRFLVPTDLHESSDRDFRGVTTFELSSWLAAATRATPNVTAIFDCCHSARLMRGAERPTPTLRSLPRGYHPGLTARLTDLAARGSLAPGRDGLGNTDAVRIFACGEEAPAWEVTIDGGPRGLLTDSLVRILGEVGEAPVTWGAIGCAVGERMRRRIDDQVLELVGPIGRVPFSLDEPRRPPVVAVAADDRGLVVRAGSASLLQPGDTLTVVPIRAAATEVVPEGTRGIVVFADVDESTARLDTAVTVPEDAVAFIERQHPPHRIRIVGDDTRLRRALARLPWAILVDEDARPLLATVRISDGVTVADELGPLCAPLSLARDHAGSTLGDVVGTMVDLACASSLLQLPRHFGREPPAIDVAVQRVGGAPIEPTGAAILAGEWIDVTITNRSASTIHVHVLHVDSRGGITRVTHDTPYGVGVSAGASVALGGAGWRVSWPPGLPALRPRPLDLVVVATVGPTNLAALETFPAGARRAPHRAGPLHRDIVTPAAIRARIGATGASIATWRLELTPPAS